MATKADIRENAAENLGILGEGTMLPSYATGDLNQAISEVYNTLDALDLVSWEETDDVPAEFAWAIAMLVADARATKYKVPPDTYQRIKLESADAMRLIRRLAARRKVGQTQIESF